jgi:hypothetical protein
MEQSTTRARAGDPPQLDAPLDILRELLTVERERLTVARRIEEERRIVFPETSVILRDILRIMIEIERRETGLTGSAQMESDADELSWLDIESL